LVKSPYFAKIETMVQIKNLIEPSLFPLKSTDTIEFALETLLAYKLAALPVVEGDKMLGFIESFAIADEFSELSIAECMVQQPAWIVNENYYFEEAVNRFGEFGASCLAIVDNDQQFSGIISPHRVLNFLSNSYSNKAEGCIICLEMPSKNYSLNELSRIIESNDAKILGVSIFTLPENQNIHVSLKLNTTYSERIIATLQRYGFNIFASFYDKQNESDFENRYQSLLKYMEF